MALATAARLPVEVQSVISWRSEHGADRLATRFHNLALERYAPEACASEANKQGRKRV